jgi:hypothetical protein
MAEPFPLSSVYGRLCVTRRFSIPKVGKCYLLFCRCIVSFSTRGFFTQPFPTVLFAVQQKKYNLSSVLCLPA